MNDSAHLSALQKRSKLSTIGTEKKLDKKEPTVLEIITIGHPVLHSRAEEVQNIDDEIRNLAYCMVKTMHSAPGIGLAAPQVEKGLRLITIDLSVGEKEDELIILVNPEIISQEGEALLEEGCLSVPGVNERVKRPYKIHIKGIDLDGKEISIEAEGLLARVFSHEIDHLNGKLFIEHLSPLKQSLLKKSLKKKKAEA
jgi:peptide deformylase